MANNREIDQEQLARWRQRGKLFASLAKDPERVDRAFKAFRAGDATTFWQQFPGGRPPNRWECIDICEQVCILQHEWRCERVCGTTLTEAGAIPTSIALRIITQAAADFWQNEEMITRVSEGVDEDLGTFQSLAGDIARRYTATLQLSPELIELLKQILCRLVICRWVTEVSCHWRCRPLCFPTDPGPGPLGQAMQ